MPYMSECIKVWRHDNRRRSVGFVRRCATCVACVKVLLDEEVELLGQTVDDVDTDRLRTLANYPRGMHARTRRSASGQNVKLT